MSDGAVRIAVAVPGPFYGALDYLADSPVAPGIRARVPLGQRHVIGVVWESREASEVPRGRLRHIQATLDDTPLLPPTLRALLAWTAAYYHYPLGETILAALPSVLRSGAPAQPSQEPAWTLTDRGYATNRAELRRRAPRQAAVLERVAALGTAPAAAFAGWTGDWRGALSRLCAAERVTLTPQSSYGLIQGGGDAAPVTLTAEQATAREALGTPGFSAVLLEGVTGSGKTEVYLRWIEQEITAGRQALIIVPEIGLTPQLLARFTARLYARIAVVHSALAEGERLNAWLAAREGQADVIIGTRSAVYTPLARPGIIVVDEEHDASLKQQEGLRYSARDIAVVRAQRLEVPVVLGSATPSLESLHNAELGRYRHQRLIERTAGARLPSYRLLDVRGQTLHGGLCAELMCSLRRHLEAEGQALIFLNRRGFAPTLICHECGWLAECPRCDARLTYHRDGRRLQCHHCGHRRRVQRVCPECGSADLRSLGLGTEQVETALLEYFPEFATLRIDRDSTRRKGALEQRLDTAQRGAAQLLLGTQILAKGHHLPEVSLVAIVDADQGLFGVDFHAPERLAQLITQVAGRAGRAERPGEVIIQTHHPEHPLLNRLIQNGYHAFAEDALAERREAGLPPFRPMALLRAEAPDAEAPRAFLAAARQAADARYAEVTLAGPAPAPMERRAGRYRAQLMLQADNRRALHTLLGDWIPGLGALPGARRVRWSVDVDPTETL